MLPLKEFNEGRSKLNSLERKQELNKLSNLSEIKLVDYEIINFDNEQGQENSQK